LLTDFALSFRFRRLTPPYDGSTCVVAVLAAPRDTYGKRF
jgi:hypothetical protein